MNTLALNAQSPQPTATAESNNVAASDTTSSSDRTIHNTAPTCDQNPAGKLCFGVDAAADAFFFDFRFFAITVYIVPLYRMGYIHDYIISQVDEICKATVFIQDLCNLKAGSVNCR